MVSEPAFVVLVALVAVQRLFETRLSRAHERKLRARGAIEHAREQMPWMVALHAGWLLSTLLEVTLLGTSAPYALSAAALALFCVGQLLRVLAMRALGERWTVRVLTLPDAPAVSSGLFRLIRHPNYLGVVLEIFALPLVRGAYLTSAVFSVLNAILLKLRIAAEENALRASGDYQTRMEHRPRFLPRPGRG